MCQHNLNSHPTYLILQARRMSSHTRWPICPIRGGNDHGDVRSSDSESDNCDGDGDGNGDGDGESDDNGDSGGGSSSKSSSTHSSESSGAEVGEPNGGAGAGGEGGNGAAPAAAKTYAWEAAFGAHSRTCTPPCVIQEYIRCTSVHVHYVNSRHHAHVHDRGGGGETGAGAHAVWMLYRSNFLPAGCFPSHKSST